MSEPPKIESIEYDSSVPVIDREQLDNLLMAESEEEAKSLACELYSLYEEEAAKKLSNLDQICRERDAETLKDIMHFVAGSGGNLGLMRMSAFFRAIETAIDEGRQVDFDACAALIPKEFERSCVAFREAYGLN